MEQNGEKREAELRAELERVKKERDAYRSDLRDILLKHYEFDLFEHENDVRDIENGKGIPLSKFIEDLKTEFAHLLPKT